MTDAVRFHAAYTMHQEESESGNPLKGNHRIACAVLDSKQPALSSPTVELWQLDKFLYV